ncbi:MAG: hypothetical protein GWP05_07895 [Anaerolineaceae bacterium]|nr:hypothetical protein [Anaerolineaceae bacterium]
MLTLFRLALVFVHGDEARDRTPGARSAGDQIPAVYHEFVRTKDARQMKIVLHHNALDLLTLAELTVLVLQGCEVDGL